MIPLALVSEPVWLFRAVPDSGRFRPDEIRTQGLVYGPAVVGFLLALGRVEEGVIRRRQAVGVETHQVRDHRPDPPLLVVQHDRRAAGGAGAQLERSVRVLRVERLTIQGVRVVDLDRKRHV